MAWTEKDVPDQSGRLAIVTGSNTGLGLRHRAGARCPRGRGGDGGSRNRQGRRGSGPPTQPLPRRGFHGAELPNLLLVDGSRVVVVASIAHNIRAKMDFDDLQWERRRYERVASYGQSKLANLMFA